jgi:hypothetical protein
VTGVVEGMSNYWDRWKNIPRDNVALIQSYKRKKGEDMYQEETSFNIRFSLEANFSDDYEGEEDALAWVRDWDTRVKPDVMKAVFQTLRQFPEWGAHIRNRGMAATDEIEIALIKNFAGPRND